MIALEENEITTRGGKVKACAGKKGPADRRWSQKRDVCCHRLKVCSAVDFICIDCQVSAKLNVAFINEEKCFSDRHQMRFGDLILKSIQMDLVRVFFLSLRRN